MCHLYTVHQYYNYFQIVKHSISSNQEVNVIKITLDNIITVNLNSFGILFQNVMTIAKYKRREGTQGV